MKTILFLEHHTDPSARSFIARNLETLSKMGCKTCHYEFSSEKAMNSRLFNFSTMENIIGAANVKTIANTVRIDLKDATAREKRTYVTNITSGIMRSKGIVKNQTSDFFSSSLSKLYRPEVLHAFARIMDCAQDIGIAVNYMDYRVEGELSKEKVSEIENKMNRLQETLDARDKASIKEKTLKLANWLGADIRDKIHCEDEQKFEGFMQELASVHPRMREFKESLKKSRDDLVQYKRSLCNRNYHMVKHIIDQSVSDSLTIALNGAAHGEEMKQLLEEVGHDVLSVFMYNNEFHGSYSQKWNAEFHSQCDPSENRLAVNVADKESYEGLMDKITDFVHGKKVDTQLDEAQAMGGASQQRKAA